ncbi:MAG TPA: alpha-glucuronidase family glycosyl hydrolase [Candidatus Hydrogenedentes bacterium]|nr:alpha-glucuronidase family glycosyl hydrolase [Candidatus Hydrogenedentota bacterium]
MRPNTILAWGMLGILFSGSPGWAAHFSLVTDGEAAAVIYAPGEEASAGLRLRDRVHEWTGAALAVHSQGRPHTDSPLIAIGTVQTNEAVRAALEGDARLQTLGEQGFILKVVRSGETQILLAAGNTPQGVNNAISELVSWELRLDDRNAWVAAELDKAERPGLKYRLLWGQATDPWAPTLEETIQITNGRAPNPAQDSAEKFLNFNQRRIDYASDHKLNGLILYYLINEKHGGLAAAQDLTRWGRLNNVRILSGVATMSSYHGFTMNENHRFHFKEWNRLHPELRLVGRDGEFMEGICPCKPLNQAWLREGTRWFLETLPDLGGVNLENGDWIICWSEDCLAARHQPENDPNFFWDQMATYQPCLDAADAVRPDAWLTFATYAGFSEGAIQGAMHGAIQTRRAAGDSTRIVYPPKFVKQLPHNAVCQWTLTGMTGPEGWPEGLRPPESTFKEHIGLLHQSSPWWGPTDPEKWWADEGPGSTWEDITELIQFMCSRLDQAGMHGLVLKGLTAASAPAKELNYLALEYFGWYPQNTYGQFINERLSVALGGRERAELFLRLLRNTTRDPDAIERDRQQALRSAQARDLDVRQRERWKNLATELRRRSELARDMESEAGRVKDQMVIKPNPQQEGFILVTSGEIKTGGDMIEWGWQGGNAIIPFGMHTVFGLTAPDVKEARLRIPLTDIPRSPDTSATTQRWVVQHFIPADPSAISEADVSSSSLGNIGVYREPGEPKLSGDAFREFDITALLKQALQGGRTTFAWRILPEGDAPAADSRLAFPAGASTNISFPPENRGARLIITRYTLVGSEAP